MKISRKKGIIVLERSEIAVAGALLLEISQDERERAKFRSRRMFETDQVSNFLTAVDRETHLRMLKVARNMKDAGEPYEKIIKYTGLSINEIESL